MPSPAGTALKRGVNGAPDFTADGGVAALGAEFEVGAEGFEGAVGLAGGLGEARRGGWRGWRVEG